MLKLWENPLLSVEDRLAAATGEIERLHDLLARASQQAPSKTLESIERCYKMLLTEPNARDALFKAEEILRGILDAEGGKK